MKCRCVIPCVVYILSCLCATGCGGGGDGDEFQGGYVNISTLIVNDVTLSNECNATPESEQFLKNLITWAMTPPPDGLGLLKSVFIPGYPDLEGGESANFTLSVEIPVRPPINIDLEVPMVRSDDSIISQGETFIDEAITYLVIDCRMTAYASGIIVPTSNTEADATINLRDLTLSGPACLPFTPQEGCTLILEFHGALE